jgi:hypothetical protein
LTHPTPFRSSHLRPNFHRSLTLDQTFAYGTFLHTIVCTAPRLEWASVPGLCGLIAAALIVYSIAVPLRSGAQGYSFWHTLWHFFVFLGQDFICSELPRNSR